MKQDRLILPSAMYEVTQRCNLACRYCYNVWKRAFVSADGKCGKKTDDSYSNNLRTLRRLCKSATIQHISLTGGEPFLADRLTELVLYCRMQGAAVSIISNGNCAERQQYQQMLKLGVSQLTFPLHAASPEIHDRMTGTSGSWFRSIRSIREVLDLGGRVVSSMVLTRINHDQIEPTLLLNRKLGITQVMVNRFNIGGAGIQEAQMLSPTPAQLRTAFQVADRVGSRLGLSLSSNVAVPFCLTDPDDYPHIHFPGCSGDALRRPLTLEPGGNLRACNHSPVVIGNIFETSLRTVLESERMRHWRTTVPEFCSTCDRYARCLGGCRAAAEQVGMSDENVDPMVFLHSAEQNL